MIERMHSNAKATVKCLLAAGLAGWCGLAAAEDVRGNLLFPWETHGKLYATGPNTLMLLGEMEGTLYTESGKGKFDGSTMVCPMVHEIRVDDMSVRGEGRCTIFPKGDEDVVFATYTCSGQVGVCAGTIEFAGGTGTYKDVYGSGIMSSRTGVADLAVKLGPGGSITNAEGLMRINDFTGGFGGKKP